VCAERKRRASGSSPRAPSSSSPPRSAPLARSFQPPWTSTTSSRCAPSAPSSSRAVLTSPHPTSQQRPPLPKSGHAGTKRKLEAPTLDPESYKSARLDSGTGATPSAGADSKGKGRAVTIQDGSDDDDDDDNDERAEFAPGQDADYFAEEDEDGRFLCVLLSLPSLPLHLSPWLDADPGRTPAVEEGSATSRSRCSTSWKARATTSSSRART